MLPSPVALGISQARLSQILDLLNTSPAVQEAVLTGEMARSELALGAVVREASWEAKELVVGGGSRPA